MATSEAASTPWPTPTGDELGALSTVIMRAESDPDHWPFPVRRLSPFEMARVILLAGYRPMEKS
jgi:hypothetical protein